MQRFYVLVLFVAVSLMLAGATKAYSQEAVEEEDVQYALGDLVMKGENSLTLSEINYETEEETQETYVMDVDTQWDNIESINDLKEGDEVEVFYRVVDQKRMAMVVAKSEVEDEEVVVEEESVEGLTEQEVIEEAPAQ